MAIALPYPDLDFVPLDPLSAEEMNQIVANYTFLSNQFPLDATNIADGAITNAKLATGAVKSDNIDWPTLGEWIPLTLSSAVSRVDWLGDLAYRKEGNLVHIRGGISFRASTVDNATISTLPSDIRPLQRESFIILGNDRSMCRCDVIDDGRLLLGSFATGILSSPSSQSGIGWWSVNCTYFV